MSEAQCVPCLHYQLVHASRNHVVFMPYNEEVLLWIDQYEQLVVLGTSEDGENILVVRLAAENQAGWMMLCDVTLLSENMLMRNPFLNKDLFDVFYNPEQDHRSNKTTVSPLVINDLPPDLDEQIDHSLLIQLGVDANSSAGNSPPPSSNNQIPATNDYRYDSSPLTSLLSYQSPERNSSPLSNYTNSTSSTPSFESPNSELVSIINTLILSPVSQKVGEAENQSSQSSTGPIRVVRRRSPPDNGGSDKSRKHVDFAKSQKQFLNEPYPEAVNELLLRLNELTNSSGSYAVFSSYMLNLATQKLRERGDSTGKNRNWRVWFNSSEIFSRYHSLKETSAHRTTHQVFLEMLLILNETQDRNEIDRLLDFHKVPVPESPLPNFTNNQNLELQSLDEPAIYFTPFVDLKHFNLSPSKMKNRSIGITPFVKEEKPAQGFVENTVSQITKVKGMPSSISIKFHVKQEKTKGATGEFSTKNIPGFHKFDLNDPSAPTKQIQAPANIRNRDPSTHKIADYGRAKTISSAIAQKLAERWLITKNVETTLKLAIALNNQKSTRFNVSLFLESVLRPLIRLVHDISPNFDKNLIKRAKSNRKSKSWLDLLVAPRTDSPTPEGTGLTRQSSTASKKSLNLSPRDIPPSPVLSAKDMTPPIPVLTARSMTAPIPVVTAKDMMPPIPTQPIKSSHSSGPVLFNAVAGITSFMSKGASSLMKSVVMNQIVDDSDIIVRKSAALVIGLAQSGIATPEQIAETIAVILDEARSTNLNADEVEAEDLSENSVEDTKSMNQSEREDDEHKPNTDGVWALVKILHLWKTVSREQIEIAITKLEDEYQINELETSVKSLQV
ncbi:hypothetical protein HK096_005700 [Nowakowskiella sp. JEL0078]|nr:hypothetical protein HK096_005700 [Nowakowskiella sp. JEL0078]